MVMKYNKQLDGAPEEFADFASNFYHYGHILWYNIQLEFLEHQQHHLGQTIAFISGVIAGTQSGSGQGKKVLKQCGSIIT